MTAVALVIFDCDGVLVDSERITNAVFQRLLAEQGLDLTLDEVLSHFVGLSMPQCLERIATLLGRPPPPDFAARYQHDRMRALKAQVRPIDGIAAALDRIPVPVCVASSGDYTKMQATLGATGLLQRFEGRIFSVVDVEHPKPAPDVYLLAARTLGVAPSACVVIEDTDVGVRAGVAAGMTVLGYTGTLPAPRLLEAGARQTFDRMADLPDLLEELGDPA